jgi:hypothetical protein
MKKAPATEEETEAFTCLCGGDKVSLDCENKEDEVIINESY